MNPEKTGGPQRSRRYHSAVPQTRTFQTMRPTPRLPRPLRSPLLVVLSLMASALVASGISRLLSAPLYASLAGLQLNRLSARLERTAENRIAGT